MVYKLSLVLFFWFSAMLLPAQEVEDPWLPLPSLPNARDAGGYMTESGNQIKEGVLLRSNQTALLTAEECEYLKTTVGLEAIIDLRFEIQRLESPEAPCLQEFTDYFPAGVWKSEDFAQGLTMEELYVFAVNEYAESYKTVFEVIANPANLPVLIHCVAGKDRTGMAIALIHRLLGVDDETIMQSFMLSNEAGPAFFVAESWLQAVLDLVDQEGGIEPFLQNRGISLETQEAVRANLLVEPVRVGDWRLYHKTNSTIYPFAE
jgi:protein-tyrosine phosphatase